MTLTELLTAICFVTPLVSAVETVHRTKVGVGGYALGIALGAPLAFGAASAMYLVVVRVGTAMKSLPSGKKHCMAASF